MTQKYCQFLPAVFWRIIATAARSAHTPQCQLAFKRTNDAELLCLAEEMEEEALYGLILASVELNTSASFANYII